MLLNKICLTRQKTFLFIFCLLSFVHFCCSQKHSKRPANSKSSYVEKSDNQFNSAEFYIACVVLNELKNYNKDKIFSENQEFLNIASKIQTAGLPNANVDSLIENFAQTNNQINVYSDSTRSALDLFIKSYDLVELIFSEIDSDDMEEEMHVLTQKVMKIESVKKIYLLYMKNRPDLSSLSSAEGVALNIHLSYYLYTLDESNRKVVVKALL